MQFLWIALLVLAVVIEALTAEMVAIWFLPSAIVALGLSFIPGFSPLWQALVFVGLGVVLTLAFRPLCLRFLKPKDSRTNVDAMIGKDCLVTEEINNIAEQGEVKLGGLCWSARSADDSVIPLGAKVTVLEVRGVKLIVAVKEEDK